MLPPNQRTPQQFEAAMNYAVKQLLFFRQLPEIVTKPLLQRAFPKDIPPNHVVLREGK